MAATMRERVVEANRAFYTDEARAYAQHRSSDGFLSWYRPMFDRHWKLMQPLLPSSPEALDCCSGDGVMTRCLADAGCRVTAVDLSPDLLALQGDEAAERVCAEIGTFLQETDRSWDLIAFASALHHLWDYDDVIRGAIERLRPGGIIYIVGEPMLQVGRAARVLRQAELVGRKVKRSPGDVPAAIRRRLKFIKTKSTVVEEGVPAPAIGFYVEIHAFGLQFDRITAALSRLETLKVERVTTGPRALKLAKRVLPGYDADNFSLIARLEP